MIKRLLPLIAVILLSLSIIACKPDPVSENAGVDGVVLTEYTVNGEPLLPKYDGDVRFSYAGISDLVFTFSLPSSQYSHLVRNCSELEVGATVTELGGEARAFTALVVDLGDQGGERLFDVSVGGVFADGYLTEYYATLTLEFKDEKGTARAIAVDSTAATVYDVAYAEYCDRSYDSTADYPHIQGESYSPYADLSTRYSVLSSVINLDIELGNVRDAYENEAYSSLYELHYFDGLLTVSMKNGDMINAGLLKSITLDGAPIYFEVNEGIIRVVLEN